GPLMKKKTGTSFLLAVLTLAGCATNEEIGKPPALSPVGSGAEPTVLQAYHYPQRQPEHVSRYSLWSDRQSRFLTAPRALEVGDILTVITSINDKAEFENESERSRRATRNLGIAGSFAIGRATGSAE